MSNRRRNTFLLLFFVLSALGTRAAQDRLEPWPPARVPVPAASDAGPSAAAGTDAATRGVPFPLSLPIEEIAVSDSLGTVPAHDSVADALGLSTGEIALLSWESFRIKASTSADSGVTFGPEVVVAGFEDGPVPIANTVNPHGFEAVLAPDAKLYVLFAVGDPQGDIGLRLRRSDDMGRTWAAAADLVKSGDPQHGLRIDLPFRLAANGSGRVAVTFGESWEGKDSYVTVSSDAGAHWSSPQRLDAADTSGLWLSEPGDVAVDGAGNVHVVFLENRGPATGQAPHVFYRRSTDGGATFSPEVDLSSSTSGLVSQGSSVPDLAIASDGSVLASFRDAGNGGSHAILRSSTAGASWATAFVATTAGTPSLLTPPRLVPSPANATVLYVTLDGTSLRCARSTNNGAAFAAFADLALNVSRYEIVRTDSGRWGVAWGAATTVGDPNLNNVWVKVSTTDGASFGDPQKADEPPTGNTSDSKLQQLTASASDELFVLYLDTRPGNGSDTNLWANVSAAKRLSLTAANEHRVDADSGQDNHAHYDMTAVSGDGANHVYVAFRAEVAGRRPDLYVAASADGGRTYATPVRVNPDPAASFILGPPVILAYPDGRVYVAYYRYDADGTLLFRLAFQRSLDYGQTWGPQTLIGGTFVLFDSVRIAAEPSGYVYLTWSDNDDVWFARSLDSGASWQTPTVIDQDTTGNSDSPEICSQSGRVFVIYRAPNVAFTHFSVWAVASANSGTGFSPKVQLRSELGAGVDWLDVTCNAAGDVLAFWSDLRSGPFQVWSNRFIGSSWMGEVRVGGPPGLQQYAPKGVFLTNTNAAVVFGDVFSVWLARTNDGGATWLPVQTLDAGAPQPTAVSRSPRLATDRQGNLWAAWSDMGIGRQNVAMTHSGDGGATFDAVRRAEHDLPQGARYDAFDYTDFQPLAAAPGVAFVAYMGERSSNKFKPLTIAWQAGDLDRDGVAAASDCSDEDAAAGARPATVEGLALAKSGGAVHLSWPAVPSAAAYDLVHGDLALLRGTGGFTAATCLGSAIPATTYDDAGPLPDPGAGEYVLGRATGACRGSFGDSSITSDPRDALDAAGPCP